MEPWKIWNKLAHEMYSRGRKYQALGAMAYERAKELMPDPTYAQPDEECDD